MRSKKEQIKKAFSRAARTYDAYADFQKEVAEELTFFMEKDPGITLDIGCGTGMVIESIKKIFPAATVYGCDIAYPMLQRAREKSGPNSAKLLCGECENLPFNQTSFDTVTSSLTYQWVTDFQTAFKEVKRVLRPGGVFIFSTLGPLTFKELRRSIEEARDLSKKNGTPPPMDFIGKERLMDALKKEGFEDIRSKQELKERRYQNLMEFLKALKNVGAVNPSSNGNDSLARGRLLREIEGVYEKRFSIPEKGGIKATYDLIYISSKRPAINRWIPIDGCPR